MTDLIGRDVGRYHIVEQLGQGGMATVYKAYDTRLERDVAVKFIRVDVVGSAYQAQMLKRFEREAKSLARLSHPNIVKVHDFGEYEGAPYLVMEYLSGGTLKSPTGRPMPYTEAAALLAPMARALQCAHEENIIHRDIKPANILLTKNGIPMLSDFGIAKILDVNDASQLTSTGVSIGTPEYMAPEQGLGQVVDGRSDQYALGVVFYELVTGRPPYSADTPLAVILKHIHDPLPRPRQFVPGLPEAVEQVIFKVLAKKPEERYASMAEFALALEKLFMQVHTSPVAPPALTEAATVAAVLPQTPVRPVAAEKDVNQLPPTLTQRPPKIQNRPNRKGLIGLAGGLGVFMVGGVVLVLLVVGGIWLAGKGLTPTPTLAPTPVPTSVPTKVITTAPTRPPTATILVSTPTEALGTESPRISEKDGMKLLAVPAGEFQMGSNNGSSDENPIHTVNLDTFWIDQTEVTNAMYAKCVSAGSCQASSYKDEVKFNGDQQPVVGVDWNQASAYCAWAGRRLPTEAEWEKAARGLDGRTWPWGNQAPDKSLLNYNQNNGKTTDVGSYPGGASPYGALDMAGNVWEWVADWYSDTYYQNTPDRNPTGPDSGQYRVLRGGSWGDNAASARSALRYCDNPTDQYYYIGFRCAVSRP